MLATSASSNAILGGVSSARGGVGGPGSGGPGAPLLLDAGSGDLGALFLGGGGGQGGGGMDVPLLSMEMVLADPQGYDVFAQFMAREGGHKLLTFFVRVELFRDLDSGINANADGRRLHAALELAREYLFAAASSTQQQQAEAAGVLTCVPNFVRIEVASTLAAVESGRERTVPATLFDEAQEAVMESIKSVFFPRFVATADYAALARAAMHKKNVFEALAASRMLEEDDLLAHAAHGGGGGAGGAGAGGGGATFHG